MTDEQRARYEAACHAMQTGVALELAQGSKSGTPKHLRVGVNSALVETSAIFGLLIRKGIITEAEYAEAIVQGMEAEARRYQDRAAATLGPGVRLA